MHTVVLTRMLNRSRTIRKKDVGVSDLGNPKIGHAVRGPDRLHEAALFKSFVSSLSFLETIEVICYAVITRLLYLLRRETGKCQAALAGNSTRPSLIRRALSKTTHLLYSDYTSSLQR